MKLLPVLLLNLATVGGALMVYDQLRSEEGAPAQVSTARVDASAIEERLSALETARRPLLRGASAEARILERLTALERRGEERGPSSAETSVVEATARTTAPLPATRAKRGEEPTAEDVESFRKLRSAARKADMARKNEALVAQALEKTGILLTGPQRQQIAQALMEFVPRRAEIWGEVKSRGAAAGDAVDWRVIITEANTVIQREFAERISDVVHAADAEVISAAVLADGK